MTSFRNMLRVCLMVFPVKSKGRIPMIIEFATPFLFIFLLLPYQQI